MEVRKDLRGRWCCSAIETRNVTIPVTRHDTFSTVYPGQTQVEVEVYQGEPESASENHFLGYFMLEGIPASSREKEKLDIAFTYNINGMLQVEATVISTGRKADLTIDLMNGEKEAFADVSNWREAACSSSYRSVIRRAEKYLQQKREADMIADDVEDVLDET